MQQLNYITMDKIEDVKKCVESLCAQGKIFPLEIRKTRTKGEVIEVRIEGVYGKFFTVRETKKNIAVTVQYVDVLLGIVRIAQPE